MISCTHVACQVRDCRAAIRFYERYAGMVVVHERTDESVHVAWMGWPGRERAFVVVLLEAAYERNTQPPYQHIGFAVDNMQELEALYARAKADGYPIVWEMTDGGEVVGRYFGLADPDGNIVEFSYGQQLGPTA